MNFKGGKKEKNCKACNEKFFVYPGNTTQNFCSKKCSYSHPSRSLKMVNSRQIKNNFIPSETTRKLMSKAQKGKTFSKQTRKKLSLSVQRRITEGGNVNQFGGYKGGYINKLCFNLRRIAKGKGAEGAHTTTDWIQLKKRFGSICLCCFRKEVNVVLTQDHIIPLSLGGSDNIENIQPLCKSCNSKKWTNTTNYIVQNSF